MTNTEKRIWDLILKGIGNEYGTAAIMGNLKAESAMNTLCMTGNAKAKWTSSNAYAEAINSGDYDGDSFAHDGIAFGLVQWLYWSRKKALYDFAKGKDISSPEVQIGYMLQELPKYKTAWKAVTEAVNIQVPCDTVMEKYEKPANISEAMKQRRREYATLYYIAYHTKPDPAEKTKKVITTMDSVLVRAGNGKEFGIISKIPTKGTTFPWVATSENNWHAIRLNDRVAWISGAFTKVIEE